MNKPLVSVIIPIYNCESTIEETIQSVLNQNYGIVEIILVENGSTDNTLESICKYVNGHSVKLFKSNVKSASFSRNLGFKFSSGDYILFLDSDDILDSNYINEHIRFLELKNFSSSIITIGNFDFYVDEKVIKNCSIENKRHNNRIELLNSLFYSIDDFMFQTTCFLVPRSFLEIYEWKNYLTLDDDGDFIFSILVKYEQVKILTDAKYYYRKKHSNKTLSKTRNKRSLMSALVCQENKFNLAKEIVDFNIDQLIINQLKIMKDFYNYDYKQGYLGLALLVRKYGVSRINELLFDLPFNLKVAKFGIMWLNVMLIINSKVKKVI